MPTKSVQVFLGFHILMNTYLLLFWIIAILTGVRWYFIMVVTRISLMISDTEYFFMNILAICVCSLEKHMFKSFAYWKNQVVNILPWSCGSTYIPWTLTDFLIRCSCGRPVTRSWRFEPHGRQRARPPLSLTISWSLLKFMPIELVMSSNHLILCHSVLLLPSIFPSISLFQWVGCWHQVAKILELQQWVYIYSYI